MNDRCPVCNGVVDMLGDCIECGTCVICFPYGCDCEYQQVEEDEEEWEDPDLDDEESLCGFPETGILFHVKHYKKDS